MVDAILQDLVPQEVLVGNMVIVDDQDVLLVIKY